MFLSGLVVGTILGFVASILGFVTGLTKDEDDLGGPY